MRLLLAIFALMAVSFLGARTWACSFVDPNVDDGVLGGHNFTRSLVTAPTNAAFVIHRSRLLNMSGPPTLLVDTASGERVFGVEVPDGPGFPVDLALFRPAVPLDPATTYRINVSFASEVRLVVDVPDLVAPAIPAVSRARVVVHDEGNGCSRSSCGDYTTLEIDLTSFSQDDRAPQDSVSYALYVGETPEQARAAPRPDALVSAITTLLLFVDPRLAGENVFVSVSAIDMAGNESARAAPVQANMAPGGCATARTAHTTGFASLLFALAVSAFVIAARRARVSQRNRAQPKAKAQARALLSCGE